MRQQSSGEAAGKQNRRERNNTDTKQGGDRKIGGVWKNYTKSSKIFSRNATGVLGPRVEENIGLSRVNGIQGQTNSLQNRLDEMLILELHSNGEKNYLNQSVRALYKYVLSAITTAQGGPQNPDMEMLSHSKNNDMESHYNSAMGTFHHQQQQQGLPAGKSPSALRRKQIRRGSALTGRQGMTGMTRRGSTAMGGGGGQGPVTYRERLGCYLHPRDMRRLVTPFSASNEPELIVRRHAMLLNFDPIRAIIIRDRILVIVPEGADGLLQKLESRVFGGVEAENSILGDSDDENDDDDARSGDGSMMKSIGKTMIKQSVRAIKTTFFGDTSKKSKPTTNMTHFGRTNQYTPVPVTRPISNKNMVPSADLDNYGENSDDFMGEWAELNGKEWIELPFELQCVDSVLHVVCSILQEETLDLKEKTTNDIGGILEGKEEMKSDPLLVIRNRKDSIGGMKSRVESFVNSINRVLDNDEEMALMNLSRLITHPEKFIKPVTEEELEEETDEPELLLEAHLQSAVTLVNRLNLMNGQISTASDLVDQKLDSVRNRILFANMIISVFSLCVATGSFVGALFGMNLTNFLEMNERAFKIVTVSTVFGVLTMVGLILSILYLSGTTPKTGLSEREK